MQSLFKKTILALGAMAVLAGATAASAETAFQANHPRRAEVNERLANQNNRIATARADGKISGREARVLHAKDRRIRRQERAMASRQGGHITKAQQRKLNREENKVSRQIPG